MEQRAVPQKDRVLHGLIRTIDLAHKYLVIPFIYGGQLIVSARSHSIFLVVVVLLQLAFSNCPMTVLSNWLRKLSHESKAGTQEVRTGRVGVAYQKLGRFAVIPITAYIFTIAFLIGAINPWK